MTTINKARPRQEYRQSLSKRILSIPEIGVLVAVVVFFGLFVVADKSMAEPANLVRMATQGTFIGIAAFGMSYLMLVGEIDLTSGVTAALAAVVAGMLLANNGWPEWASYGAGLLAAIGVGLVNSFMTVKIRMPSFFGTLGTSFAVGGLILWLSKGQFIYLGGQLPFLDKLLTPSPFYDLPWVFLLYVAAVIVGDLLIRTSRLGAILKATGGNPRAAEITGINVPLVKTLCFVFVSFCCGVAGILVMGYSDTSSGGIGDGWLLWVIAITIIGGGSLRGGVGSVIGGLLGVILIQIIRIGLTSAQIQTNAQGIVVGAILIGAAALDVIRRKMARY